MDKKIIVYVGNFDFPFGNASGKRVYGNGKLLREIGFETIFIGMNRNTKKGISLQNTMQEFDGFQYYNYPYPQSSKEWMNYRSILADFLTFVDSRKESIHSIICYGSPRLSLFVSGVCRWGRKNQVYVLADCVDWLESKTGNLIFDIAKTGDTFYQKVVANRQTNGVICISNYLANYYKAARKKTVVIPPLATNFECIPQNKSQEVLQLVYAGNAFQKTERIKDPAALKDRVDKMIELLQLLKQRDIPFKFYYYGMDADNYLVAFPNYKNIISYLGDWIEFCGFKENGEVIEKIKQADFTILLRDIKRSTMAGFPTKVSESISCGTPVITTRTSDIDKYLQEEREVIFVNLNDLHDAAAKIKDIVRAKKHIEMKKECNASRIFHFSSFAEDMSSFLEKLEAEGEIGDV